MSPKNVRWLLGELEELVAGGVLDASAAEGLRRHYAAEAGDSTRLRELFLAILGALLVGGGVILLLAHNWTDLSRTARTLLSFTPLLLSQALAGYTLMRRRESAAWREASSVLVSLSVAAAIALIGQTYHIPGDLSSFLLTWVLLTLPLVYLFDAALPAILYLLGSLSWMFARPGLYERPDASYWLLLLPMVPYLLGLASRRQFVGRRLLFGWLLATSLALAFPATVEGLVLDAWGWAWCLVFGWLWLEGEARRPPSQSLLRSPFSWVGALGSTIVALCFSFESSWRGVAEEGRLEAPELGSWHGWLMLVLTLAGFARCGALLARVGAVERRAWARWPLLLLGSLPFLGLAAWAASQLFVTSLAPAVAFNVYLTTVGLLLLTAGLRDGESAQAHAGLALLTLLIVLRFFDSDLSFLTRGMAFVVAGLGFLFVNRVLSRHLRAREEAS